VRGRRPQRRGLASKPTDRLLCAWRSRCRVVERPARCGKSAILGLRLPARDCAPRRRAVSPGHQSQDCRPIALCRWPLLARFVVLHVPDSAWVASGESRGVRRLAIGAARAAAAGVRRVFRGVLARVGARRSAARGHRRARSRIRPAQARTRLPPGSQSRQRAARQKRPAGGRPDAAARANAVAGCQRASSTRLCPPARLGAAGGRPRRPAAGRASVTRSAARLTSVTPGTHAAAGAQAKFATNVSSPQCSAAPRPPALASIHRLIGLLSGLAVERAPSGSVTRCGVLCRAWVDGPGRWERLRASRWRDRALGACRGQGPTPIVLVSDVRSVR